MIDLIAPIFKLPWVHIFIAVLAAQLLAMLWYGLLFRKAHVRLSENKTKDINWHTTVPEFLGLLTSAYLIGLLSLHPDIYLLGIDALIGLTVLFMLSSLLYQQAPSMDRFRFWMINAGYRTVAISIMAIIIWFA
jgi:hypothetical protein